MFRLFSGSTAPLAAGLLALLMTVALLPATMVSAEASVRVREAWNFNARGQMTLKGHGFGHGHGMSQYGAAGAAERGLTEREILDFYYPGTEMARFDSNIAVLISDDTTDDVVVRYRKGLVARDRGTGARVRLPALRGVWRWRFVVKNGRTALQYFQQGRYRHYKVGGRYYLVGDGEFSSSSGRIRLLLPRRVVRDYRGVLRHARPSPNSQRRDTVNVLSIDDYVRGVVPAEMPATWPTEAVQAQAIAARTYGLFERAQNLRRHYQICDTTQCQVYRGIQGEHPASNRAVSATSRQYLTYESSPAFTQFSASSGGWTSQGSRPYLVSREDPYDAWSRNGVHDWRVTIDRSTLERRYRSLGDVVGLTVTRREGGGEWRGRVESLMVRGKRGSITLSGNDLRSIYGLRSTWFTRA